MNRLKLGIPYRDWIYNNLGILRFRSPDGRREGGNQAVATAHVGKMGLTGNGRFHESVWQTSSKVRMRAGAICFRRRRTPLTLLLRYTVLVLLFSFCLVQRSIRKAVENFILILRMHAHRANADGDIFVFYLDGMGAIAYAAAECQDLSWFSTTSK